MEESHRMISTVDTEPNLQIMQHELERLVQLRRQIMQLKREHASLRASLLKKHELNASVERGRLVAKVRHSQFPSFTRKAIAETLGEEYTTYLARALPETERTELKVTEVFAV